MIEQRPILVLLPSLRWERSLASAVESLLSLSAGLCDVLVLTGGGGCVAVMNAVPRELLATYKIVGIFNDDCRMRTPNWDTLVCHRLAGKNGLVYGRDGHQNEKLCTHPFVSSGIFLTLGFIHPPGLHHFSGDKFLMELLQPLGKVEYLPEIFTEHLHPDAGKSPMDGVYSKSRQFWNSDQKAWEEYRSNLLPGDRNRVKRFCP